MIQNQWYVILASNELKKNQDRRVVETHQPQETSFKMEENLISGDFPVIMYRKKRDTLKQTASPSKT